MSRDLQQEKRFAKHDAMLGSSTVGETPETPVEKPQTPGTDTPDTPETPVSM